MQVILPEVYLEKKQIGSLNPGSLYRDVASRDVFMVTDGRFGSKVTVVKVETGVRLSVLSSSYVVPVGHKLITCGSSVRVAVGTLGAGRVFVGDGGIWLTSQMYDLKSSTTDCLNLRTGKITQLDKEKIVTAVDARLEIDYASTVRLFVDSTDSR